MLYQGKHLSAKLLAGGIVELNIDVVGSVNKLNQDVFDELRELLSVVSSCEEAKGLLITSAKDNFIVGADINEFLPAFSLPDAELTLWIKRATDTFDRIEDLNIPTLAAIKGFALGGGCELILSCDYRIADSTAVIGLPEVKLGIMPGFGGTVRLPRLIGADNAIEWMSTGKAYKPDQALAVGTVDAVTIPGDLHHAAISTLVQAIEGKLDWRSKRQAKLSALTLSPVEKQMVFATCKAMIHARAKGHYPAPVMMVETVEAAAEFDRKAAMALENKQLAVLAKTDAATAQVGLFLADQVIKSKAKKVVKLLSDEKGDIKKAAVVGAGIMGGGIAYQSAYKNIPVVLKDINEDALSLGMTTAANILNKLVDKKRITHKKQSSVLTQISPSLNYASIQGVDIVVEAVVETPKIKQTVLAEIESNLDSDAIITSNTSTISIDLLAEPLHRKDKFCGMHFFNPVNKMPLVEVIRGSNTSEKTIASVVAFANAMGKSAIVVNDCPGFYVNRVLFPYFSGFSQLLLAGADFVKVDKVMENVFGWPMGPAYLLDVVGLDTADHCADVMAEGFPKRMAKIANDPIHFLYREGDYGQKSGNGFYQYHKDKKGKLSKKPAEKAIELTRSLSISSPDFSEQEIIIRLMIPMINEVILCLEEGIIESAYEADMGLIYALGFPPFRGGPIRYLEAFGLKKFIELADEHAHLGNIYHVSDDLRKRAKTGVSYFDV